MTENAADAVLAQINSLDLFDDIRTLDFEQGIHDGKIEYIAQTIIDQFIENVLSQQVNPGICAKAGLKLVYSPLTVSYTHL